MNLKEKIREIEYRYWIDKVELGKVTVIASLALLVVSIHAVHTMNVAVEQAQESNERMQTTATLVQSNRFQQSMDNLADTGATIGGESITDVVAELQYASESVGEVEELTTELENARSTYQWMVVIGILGLVGGLTAIYI